MELGFSNCIDPKYDSLEKDYADLMAIAFKHLGKTENYEVDVTLVDEATIQEINRDYRGVDRVTDVISFAFLDNDDGIIAGDCLEMLGEIYICVPRALEQAKEIGNTPERELSFLFVHGLLHLLGYDHMKKEDEEIMFPLQETILDKYKEAKS